MMDAALEQYLKNLALDKLMKSPAGEKIQKALQTIEVLRTNVLALSGKKDELGMTGVKAATVMTFSILKKIADGKTPSDFEKEDWQSIAQDVSELAILPDGTTYSVFIFGLYERYIRYSVSQIQDVIPPETSKEILRLADELRTKAGLLKSDRISEVKYTEDCLWTSLEAMVKLLASTAALSGDMRITDFAQAVASFAFEYGRLMLYRRELELVNQYVEAQNKLDAELEQKFQSYLRDLRKATEQFYTLIDNAFSPNFQTAFLHSILLAKASGVKESEILSSTEDIDDFFMN